MKIFINNVYIYNNYGSAGGIQDQVINNQSNMDQDDGNNNCSPQIIAREYNSLIANLEKQILKSKRELKELKENLQKTDQ